jgi:hypothetical protein
MVSGFLFLVAFYLMPKALDSIFFTRSETKVSQLGFKYKGCDPDTNSYNWQNTKQWQSQSQQT